jgi:hypothetical protein
VESLRLGGSGRRSGDLLDAPTGFEEPATLLPPFSLRPLVTLGDAPQCCEFVVRHAARVIVSRAGSRGPSPDTRATTSRSSAPGEAGQTRPPTRRR